jgi:hypothetical protein
MPPTSIEIFLPCEVFDVEVQLGPREGISSLELLVLRALKEGVEYFDDLVSLFQIGYRPMLNLISDLWRQNYVALDFGTARLEVAPEVRVKLGTAAEKSLQGGERTQRVVTLMQELVCGHILLAVSQPARTHSNRIAPQLKPYGSFRQAPNAEIRQAIEGLIATWDADARPLSVLAANLHVDDLAASHVGQRRLLAVEVQCTAGESGRVELRVVQPLAKLDGSARRDLERMLAQLVEERADDLFSRFVYDHAAQRREPAAVPMRQRVRSLTARIEGLAGDAVVRNLAAAQRLHEELAEESRAALRSLVEQHARRSKLRLLTGHPAVVSAVRSAVGESLHQVVLASPRARPEPVNRAAVSLKKLLQKDQRQAFVLWGQEPDDRLDAAVQNAFGDLETSGRFFWPRLSARSNMSFLLRDDDRCILSSAPLLDDPAKDGLVIGVQVDSLLRAAPCPTVREQLERVARIFPDFNMAAKLATTMAPGAEASQLAPPDLPRIPTGPLDSLRQAAGASTIGISGVGGDGGIDGSGGAAVSVGGALLEAWRDSWSEFAAGLAVAMAALGDSVEPVHDGLHREILLQALASSPSFLVVGSTEISSRAFDPILRQAMADAARAGAKIVILYGRARRQDEAALQRMRELTQSSAGQIVAVPCDWQGGLLLVDDWLLVSSFQLLAKAGKRDEGSPLQLQHDTGLLVRSAKLVTDALAYLQTQLPSLAQLRLQPAHNAEDRPPALASAAPAAGSEHLQTLVARLAGVSEADDRSLRLRGEKIRQWLGEARAAGVSIDSVVRLIPSLDQREQGMVTAACLQLEAPGSEVHADLLRLLCADRWQTGAFHETTILRGYLNGDPVVAGAPPAWLAHIAAVRHDLQQLAALLKAQALLQPLDQEEAVALACIGCSALALGGVSEAWAVLDAQRNGLPPVLATWVDEIVSYWSDVGLAVPKSLLHGSASADPPAVRAQKAYTALLEAFDAAASTSFNFVLGKKTWGRLFHEQGELGRLGTAIRSSEAAVVRDWLSAARRLDRVAETLLDDAARQAAERDPHLREERIIGTKRVSCLQRLDELLLRMAEWVELQGASSGEPQGAILERGRRLAGALVPTREDLAALERSAAERSAVSLPLVRVLQADFAPLLKG